MFVLNSLTSLFSQNEKKRFARLVVVNLLFSFIEAIALSLIIPYITMIGDPPAALENFYAHKFYAYTGITPSSTNLFFLFTLLILTMFLVRTTLFIWISYESASFSYDFFSDKSTQLQKDYLNQCYINFSKKNSNFFVKNCTKTTENAGYAVVLYLGYLSSLIVILTLAITTVFIYPIASLLLFGTFALTALVFLRALKKKQIKNGTAREKNLEQMLRYASETFQLYKEINLYKKQSFFRLRFARAASEYGKAMQNFIFFQSIPSTVMELVAVMLLLIVTSYYVVFQIPIASLIPPLLFFAAVAKRMLPNIHKVLANKISLHNLQASINILQEELSKEHSSSKEVVSAKMNFTESLKLKNIEFSYSHKKTPLVLDGLSVSIQKMQSIAFVGFSGAGKTTLIEILTSLLLPDNGEFLLDGRHIPNLECIKHLIGYVPQGVNLIDATIKANIAFGDERIDENSLHKAIEMAHLEDFIATLPEGVNTRIGERGVRLSGGQRQRIGIARMLYRNPEILVFDEATSSLDNVTEKIISDTIKEIAGRKTVIVVAHRLTTVQHFDVIYVMDKGRIVSYGTHNQLLAKCPIYQKLNQKKPSSKTDTQQEEEEEEMLTHP